MLVDHTHITLWQGDVLTYRVQLTGPYGAPIDLTGMTVTATLDPDSTATPVTATVDIPTATVSLAITTTVTGTVGTRYIALTTPSPGGARTLAVLAVQVKDRTP